MLVEGIYSYLTANAGLQTALGVPRKDQSTGIWAGLTPDQVLVPAIAMSQVSGMPLQESFAGTGQLQSARWRFFCYGSTYKATKLLAQALRQAMLGINGTLPGNSNAEVHGVWLRLETDEQEPIPHGTLYTTILDFEINFLDLIQ